MLRNTLGKFHNKPKILSGESVLNISLFSSRKIDFSAEFHLVSFVERSALTCWANFIENYKRSDEFEMYEFERIDPRGRTPLHLGKFLPINPTGFQVIYPKLGN